MRPSAAFQRLAEMGLPVLSRRKAAARREREARFRLTADSVPALLWTSGPDKPGTFFNRHWLEFRGRTMEQELDDGWADGVHPDDLKRRFEVYQSSFDRRAPFEVEYRLRRHDGEYRWVRDRGVPQFDDRATFMGYVGSCLEIMEGKAADRRSAALAESGRLFGEAGLDFRTVASTIVRRVAELIGEYCSIHLLSDDGRLQVPVAACHTDPAVSADVERLLGPEPVEGNPLAEQVVSRGESFLRPRISPEELRSFTPARLQPLLDKYTVRSLLVVPLRGRQRVIGTLVLARTSSLEPYAEQDRDFAEALAAPAALSIESARLYERLAASEERFHGLFRNAAVGLEQVALDGRLTEVNRKLCEMVGYSEAELIGRTAEEITDPADREAERLLLAKLVSGETQSYSIEKRYQCKDGRRLWVRLTSSLGYDSAGAPQYRISVVDDISERRRAEADREAALAQARLAQSQAEEANRVKDEFLATLSHELRTPLGAIMGWAHILREQPVDERTMRKAVEVIARNANREAQLVSDILDVSRIVTGRLRLNVQITDLVKVIESAVDTVRPAAEAKRMRLEMILDPSAGLVAGDPARLEQVVWNLLSNAVKFTPKRGRVQVRLQRLNSHAELSVEDNGPGIDPEFLPYVFARFRQADSSSTRAHGGVGLGLAIVRDLVELHGGTVEAANRPQRSGAVFRVKLPRPALLPDDKLLPPLRAATPPPDQEGAVDELGQITVLAVDDEQDVRDLLAYMLERTGTRVVTASSVAEAMQRLKEERPTVLVADIDMPEEDGYSLIRRIRELPPEEGGNTPAVALTAYAGTPERIRALQMGYQIYLTKPVEPQEVLAAVRTLVRTLGRH